MLKRKYLTMALALPMALLASTSAQAAPVIKTLVLTGTNFLTDDGQRPTGTDTFDPLKITFSLNFDNGASFTNNTTGITDLGKSPYGPLKFGYNILNDTVYLVGGNASTRPTGCTFGAGAFCSFIRNISSDTPTSVLFAQSSFSGVVSDAGTRTLTAAAVPEPATWGMMILGFGAIGGMMRRRKAAARVAYA